MDIKKGFAVTGLLVVLTIGCLTSQVAEALDLDRLPDWFEVSNKRLTTKEAKELVRYYKASKQPKPKYAEAYIRLDKFDKAVEIYEEALKDKYKFKAYFMKAAKNEGYKRVLVTSESLYSGLLLARQARKMSTSKEKIDTSELLYNGYAKALMYGAILEAVEKATGEKDNKEFRKAKKAVKHVIGSYERELKKIGLDPDKF